MQICFKRTFRSLRAPVGVALLVMSAGAAWDVVQSSGYLPDFAIIGRLVTILGFLGALLGVVYAAYPGDVWQVWDRPVVRTLFALGVAVTVMIAVRVSFLAAVACVAAFGVVSWLGRKRVIYIDS